MARGRRSLIWRTRAFRATFFYQGDIAECATLERFADEVRSRFGRVDALINNAMMTRGGILGGCSYEDFLDAQRVGVAAPYYLTKLFCRASQTALRS